SSTTFSGATVTKFAMDVHVGVGEQFADDGRPAGLRGAMTCSADLFDAESVQGFADRLVRVLDLVATDPGRRVHAVPLLDETERRRVLIEWNDTAAAFGSQTLPELFQEQVARTPDAVAVVY